MHRGNNLLVLARLVNGLAQSIYVDLHNYFRIFNISTACDEQCSDCLRNAQPCKLPLCGLRPLKKKEEKFWGVWDSPPPRNITLIDDKHINVCFLKRNNGKEKRNKNKRTMLLGI